MISVSVSSVFSVVKSAMLLTTEHTERTENLIGYWIDSPGGTASYQKVVDFLYQLYQAGY